MKKIKRFTPTEVLKTLYQSLINSHLTYGIKCWGYAHAQLEKTQKKAIRVMANKKSNSHTAPLFKQYFILKIEDLFKLNCLKMHYKIEKEIAAPVFRSFHTRNWEVHAHNTRQNHIRVMHPQFERNRDCFRFYLPTLLNEIPSELLQLIHTCSFKTFEWHMKKYFIDQYSAVCLKHICPQCGRLLD